MAAGRPAAPERCRDVAPAAAALLEAERTRDAARRRPAAHLTVNTQFEHDWVMSPRYFAPVRATAPSQLDRRDWRLGGEASFRVWLARRGFPLRDRRFQR